MDDAGDDRATLRFTADRLPVTKRPLLALEREDGGHAAGAGLVLPLADGVTLREARELASRLNAGEPGAPAATAGEGSVRAAAAG